MYFLISRPPQVSNFAHYWLNAFPDLCSEAQGSLASLGRPLKVGSICTGWGVCDMSVSAVSEVFGIKQEADKPVPKAGRFGEMGWGARHDMSLLHT